MSKQIEQNPSRVSFDPGDVNIEQLDELANDRGQSRAELIRSALRRELAAVEGRDDDLPADLRDGLDAVRVVAVDGRVAVDQAESAVAQRLQISKSAARRVLRRLENYDKLRPRWGVVVLVTGGDES